jgi:hypothetical protein
MIGRLITSSLLVALCAAYTVPMAIAQEEAPDDTRIEKYEDLTQTEASPDTGEVGQSMEPMESQDGMEAPNTRTEETMDSAQSSDSMMNTAYDVRRTEAFNLVSSAYRGDFEDQGINSYATMVSNYEAGELTAEDLVSAAIDAGELSPSAMEDDSYVQAVDSQLNSLTAN